MRRVPDKTGREKVFGKVMKTRTFKPGETLAVAPGETLVVDFGQNCAGVPCFVMNARRDTVLTCLPGEMLNDANGERARGNDGPGGSLYRENLRNPANGMRLVYTFAGTGEERYMPRFTFFGYRYLSLTATDAVTFTCMRSVPVTSITKDMERGRIETGDKAVNQLISNVYWGQLSNYLSVPTDCPQRNERLGWTADTQVFCEAGAFNAVTTAFFHKWMRDMRDSQDPRGGFPGIAPGGQYGNETMRVGWSDAGVIVPFTVWRHFGDRRIVDENWAAMEKCLARQAETKYRTELLPECRNYQWNDWLSLTKFESCPYKPEYSAFRNGKPTPEALLYWGYLGGCYWVWNADMMAQMARGTGRAAEEAKYRQMAAEARAYMKATYFASQDGRGAQGQHCGERGASPHRLPRHLDRDGHADGERAYGPRLRPPPRARLPRLALLGRPGRDDDLGTLEQLREGDGLRARRHELLQPLRLRLRPRVDLQDGRRHCDLPVRPRLQDDRHETAARPPPRLRQGRVQDARRRRRHERVALRGRQVDLGVHGARRFGRQGHAPRRDGEENLPARQLYGG